MNLKVQSSPFINAKDTVPRVMSRVMIALAPAFIFGVVMFGLRVLLIFLVALITALASEILVKLIRKRPIQIEDWSAALTALLFTLCVPSSIPLQAVAIGSAFSIIVAKELFGGLGCNIFNPALAGRAFIQAAFPAWMTVYPAPSMATSADALSMATGRALDAITQSTPLSAIKYTDIVSTNAIASFAERFAFDARFFKTLAIGNHAGSIGETAFLLLLLGGAFLIIARTIDWRIPLGMAGSAFVAGLIFCLIDPAKNPTPFFHLLSGGFAIGAFFMATDMVTSPITKLGTWIYALAIGVLVILIRALSGLPEGMMYSILIANAFVPLLNRFTRPKIYGATKKAKETLHA